jgi:hypothetical protein
MSKLGHEDDNEEITSQVVDNPSDDTDDSPQAESDDPKVPQVVEASDERLTTSDEGESDDAEEDTGRSRKRESAKERRERARKAKEADKQEIEILRRTVAKQDQRFKEIEQRLTVNRVTEIDERLATVTAEAENFDRIFGMAISKNNGEDARKAAQLRDEAKQKAWALYNEKQQIITQSQQPRAAETPAYADKAVRFLADKPWYNPASGDEDSLVVEALDKALTKTMNPNDPLYWETLDRKVKEKLPHRFSDAQDDDDSDGTPPPRDTQRRKGPPTGGTNRSSSNGNRNPGQIVLPKEMVEAMKEAGKWDDPVVRARVAKRYHDGLKNRNG